MPPVPTRIFVLTALIVAGWLGFVFWTDSRADLAESNVQANLIRITRYLREPAPDVVLVGSSVGGRLLPGYFESHGVKLLNLGLDGSRPLFGFEVLKASNSRPRVILLETSALFQPLTPNDATLREAMNSPTATMGRVLPFFRAEVRPLSVLYNNVKSLRDSASGGRAANPNAANSGDVLLAADELPETYSDIVSVIKTFKEQGTEVLILDIPRGEGWAEPSRGAVRALALELNLPILEPGPAIFAEQGDVLRFSDGLHLNAPSAKIVSEWITKKIPR